jgi:hypothetical protein
VRRVAAIALCGLLAACAGADYSPLQRDLAELASLPDKLDTLIKSNTARREPSGVTGTEQAATQDQVLSAAPQDLAVVPAKPQPNIFEKLMLARKPAKQAGPGAPPGAHDQIPEPLAVENPLARPPWEALAEAGPNADNELDLELLYGAGNVPAELQAEQPPEQEIAVAQPELLLDLQPEGPAPSVSDTAKPVPPAKPGGMVINSVAVPLVTGATGKGNAELTTAMRKALKEAGWPVSTSPRKDALTIRGRVTIGKPHGPNQSAKIVWDVLTPDGKRLGDLKQDNAVPAGSLDQSWGENAGYAAEAAAEGIFKLIQKYR